MSLKPIPINQTSSAAQKVSGQNLALQDSETTDGELESPPLGLFFRCLPLFQIARVPVQVHTTFFLWPLAPLLWVEWSENGGRHLWALAIMLTVVCLSLLVHEFAHVLTARRYGIGTERVVFFPFGVVALMEKNPRMAAEFWITLAGPLASLVLGGLCLLMSRGMDAWLDAVSVEFWWQHRWLRAVLELIGFAVLFNFFVAGFNLLPVFPMDGGRLLRSGLAIAIRRFSRRSSAQASRLATRITVRWVGWPLVLAVLIFTVAFTHLWAHLLLFPLALLIGELEYQLVRGG